MFLHTLYSNTVCVGVQNDNQDWNVWPGVRTLWSFPEGFSPAAVWTQAASVPQWRHLRPETKSACLEVLLGGFHGTTYDKPWAQCLVCSRRSITISCYLPFTGTQTGSKPSASQLGRLLSNCKHLWMARMHTGRGWRENGLVVFTIQAPSCICNGFALQRAFSSSFSHLMLRNLQE